MIQRRLYVAHLQKDTCACVTHSTVIGADRCSIFLLATVASIAAGDALQLARASDISHFNWPVIEIPSSPIVPPIAAALQSRR